MFITIFLILVLVLTLLPFMATFNDILTRIVINLKGYWFIRDVIVPFEVKMVGGILTLLGMQIAITKEYVILGNPSTGSGPFIAEIIWNCIGWQSLLFFILTSWVGLQGDRYTNTSKIKTLVIGLLGTFLVNILRIVVVILVAYGIGQSTAAIVHEYGSLLVSIGWLFFFWWFSYSFVLEERV
jgi:exosortase/archaeosortase family protein